MRPWSVGAEDLTVAATSMAETVVAMITVEIGVAMITVEIGVVMITVEIGAAMIVEGVAGTPMIVVAAMIVEGVAGTPMIVAAAVASRAEEGDGAIATIDPGVDRHHMAGEAIIVETGRLWNMVIGSEGRDRGRALGGRSLDISDVARTRAKCTPSGRRLARKAEWLERILRRWRGRQSTSVA